MSLILNSDEYYRDFIREASDFFLKSTCQIIFINPTNNGSKEAIATGILLNLQGKKILLSTGHTFTSENYSNLFIFIGDEVRKITGNFFSSTPINKEERFSDKIDFGYVVLHKEVSVWLEKKYQFISWNYIKENHIPEFKQNYLAFGFPWRKTKIEKGSRGNISCTSLTLHTVGSEDFMYRKPFNKREHILVKINRKLKIIETNQWGLIPKLDGMSGGGLWHLPEQKDASPPFPTMRLVGLLMEFDSENIQVSKIDNFLKFIKRNRYHINLKS